MSMSPSTLLAKLDELKQWQKLQQERLLQQHQSRLQEASYDDIINISKQNETVNDSQIEEENVEAKIASKAEVINANTKPKQPFLRKGTGLTKFGMQFGDQKKPLNKMKPAKTAVHKRLAQLRKEEVRKRQEEAKSDGIIIQEPQIEEKIKVNIKDNKHTPLKVPEIAIKPKAKWIVPEEEEADSDNDELDDKYVINTGICFEENEKVDLSEPAASINEDLLNYLQKLASEKFVEPQLLTAPNDSTIINQLQKSLNNLEITNSNSSINRDLISYLQRLVNQYAEDNAESGSVSKSNVFDTTSDRELRLFELIEQKVMNESFCSTNSSVIELLSSTPHKPRILEPIVENKFDLIQKAKKSLDFQDSKEDSRESSVTSADLNEKTLDRNDTWQTDDDTTTYDTEESAHQNHVIMRKNVGVMTDNMQSTTDITEELLSSKLHELNTEIANFRSENKKLQKMKQDVEKERKQMQKNMKTFQKELDEERTKMEFELEEERKKLQKDKMVFERYAKDLQNKPTRREREEISNLKIELANVRETLKLKETRNGTTQARLRNQIKTLEKDNVNLKDEVEKLQKQNAKLVATQKVVHRKPSDTKMLHEINKNLTKLTNEAKINPKRSSIELENDDSFIEIENKATNSSKKNSKGKEYETEYRRSFSSPNHVKHRQRNISESSDSISSESRKMSEVFHPPNPNSLETNDAQPLVISNKENDRNATNFDVTEFTNLSDLSLINNYEKVFGGKEKSRNSSLNDTQSSGSGKTENILEDGSKETRYSNGNIKVTSANGNFIRLKYFNGDIKETKLLDGTIKYFYNETKMWQTTLADGNEIWEFPDGQVEKHFTDRTAEIYFPNGLIKKIEKDGTEKITYPDGSIVNVQPNGEKILYLPNGQKEIHTKDQKRREYPDGTVKIIYADGLQETRYSNGRIRMKDKDGKLLMDSHSHL